MASTPVLDQAAPVRRGSGRGRQSRPRGPVVSRTIGQRWYTPYLFMAPGLALFGLFFAWPAVTAIELSFYDYDVVNTPKFIGLDNFRTLIHDPLFWTAVRNSLLFLVGLIPLSVVIPLLLAVLVNQKIRGIQAFRVIYYLPVVTSMVAIGVAWNYVFHQKGVINWILTGAHILHEPIQYLLDPHWSIVALIIVEGWASMGTYMMIYLAGLQAIPNELYEAATVDGAGVWARLRYITVPLVVPFITVVLTLEMMGAMQVFTSVYVMTQGGPENHTLTLGYYIWKSAFQNYRMGYASAVGLVLWVFLIAMAFINYRVTRSRMVMM